MHLNKKNKMLVVLILLVHLIASVLIMAQLGMVLGLIIGAVGLVMFGVAVALIILLPHQIRSFGIILVGLALLATDFLHYYDANNDADIETTAVAYPVTLLWFMGGAALVLFLIKLLGYVRDRNKPDANDESTEG